MSKDGCGCIKQVVGEGGQGSMGSRSAPGRSEGPPEFYGS